MNANASVFAFQFQRLADEQPASKLAYDRPNLSVYAADGAVISGVAGKWRPGDPPKNWIEIRASFWGARGISHEPNISARRFRELLPFLRDVPLD